MTGSDRAGWRRAASARSRRERARRDADRPRRGEPPHAGVRAGVEDVCRSTRAPRSAAIFSSIRISDLLVAEEQPVVLRDLPEHAHVVDPRGLRAVGGVIEMDPLRLQQFLEDPQVQRLAVGSTPSSRRRSLAITIPFKGTRAVAGTGKPEAGSRAGSWSFELQRHDKRNRMPALQSLRAAVPAGAPAPRHRRPPSRDE